MKTLVQKREEAETRQAAYDKLSVKEKVARLDKKLGKGVGAKKQRERLMTLIKENKNEKKDRDK